MFKQPVTEAKSPELELDPEMKKLLEDAEKRDNDQKVVERKEAAKLREKQLADLTRKEEEEKKNNNCWS